MVGSPEMYGHEEREPEQSVNFITWHDGFTLNDLVSYNDKHNEANGENNRDGASDNRSWNCGIEGPTADPEVERLRKRQVKNFFTATLLSVGVPMILMGDEVRRTQYGNNNPYCQDNELNWFDWTLVERHGDILRFVKQIINRRLLRDVVHEEQRMSLNQLIHQAMHAWHGVRLNRPDWSPHSHSIAFGADLRRDNLEIFMIMNAYWEPLEFELPESSGGGEPWRRWIDTSLESPDDIAEWKHSPPISGSIYRAGPRSTVVLLKHHMR